ncbi:MAG: Mov34/MPN/PAD-1 family protein [Dehalococcoidia bacterium]|nr:Mov34/MPN/PAD-1 family protein [Dehalococcoidia bacterium]
MNLVGYYIEGKAGTGEEGLAYNYVMAENGLWLEARNDLLEARVLLADAEIRGLAPLEPRLVLKHGRIPSTIWKWLAHICALAYPNEFFGALTWVPDGSYGWSLPVQTSSRASVRFTPVERAVLEVHSHPDMSAFFSSIDDADEQAFKLYAVLGWGGQTGRKEVHIRLGIYGYFVDVPWGQVFEGSLEGWEDKGGAAT